MFLRCLRLELVSGKTIFTCIPTHFFAPILSGISRIRKLTGKLRFVLHPHHLNAHNSGQGGAAQTRDTRWPLPFATRKEDVGRPAAGHRGKPICLRPNKLGRASCPTKPHSSKTKTSSPPPHTHTHTHAHTHARFCLVAPSLSR